MRGQVVKKDIIVTIISNRGTSSDRRTTDEIENGDAAQPNKCTFSINSYVHYFLPPPPGPPPGPPPVPSPGPPAPPLATGTGVQVV